VADLPVPIEYPEASEAMELALELRVLDTIGYNIAVALDHSFGLLEERIIEDFKQPKHLSREAWLAICAQERGHLAPLQEAVRIIRQKAKEWLQAEKVRRQKEAKEKQALAHDQARQAQVAEAARLQEQDRIPEAQALMATPLDIPTIKVEDLPKGGLALVEHWTFEIENEDLIPREFLMPDREYLQKVATAQKGKTNIPGVRVYDAGVVRSI
jgi:hypothetical protein